MGDEVLRKVTADTVRLVTGASMGAVRAETRFSIIPCKEHVSQSLVTKLRERLPAEPSISLKF